MKAFLLALAALVVITVSANWLLVVIDFSSKEVSVSSRNVRIDN